MLNTFCDLPTREQPEIEPSADAPPADHYEPFREVLRAHGYSLASAEKSCPHCCNGWLRENWTKSGCPDGRLAMNDDGHPFGTWHIGTWFSGPMHRDAVVSLRVLRIVLEG